MKEKKISVIDDKSGDSGSLLSIVVITHLSRDYTKQCIEAISATVNRPYELIFVDNNSDDGTLEYIRSLDAEVVANNHRLTRGKLFNLGAKAAKGSIVLFMDDDTVPLEGWIDGLLAPLEKDCEVGIAGAYLVSPGLEEPLHQGYVIDTNNVPTPAFRRRVLKLAPEPQEAFAVNSSCMVIRKEVFDNIGGFDEEFWNEFEDIDLCLRTRQVDYKVMFCPSARVWHYELETTIRYPFKNHNRVRLQEKWNLENAKFEYIERIQNNVATRDHIEALDGWARELQRLLIEQQQINKNGLDILSQFSIENLIAFSEELNMERNKVIASKSITEGVRDTDDLSEIIDREEKLAVPTLQHKWKIEEKPFVSNASLLGGLIVRLRTAWNWMSTKWYVRPIVQQQNEYNHLVAIAVEELQVQLNALHYTEIENDRSATSLRKDIARLDNRLRRIEDLLQQLAEKRS